MSFRMQLASLPQGAGTYEPLCFATARQGPDGAARRFDPVLAASVGSEIEYGSLFSYLFRRFGFPNQPWDHAAELARYLLSTPRGDLFLSVVPRVDGRSDLSIAFLAPAAASQAAQAFVRREFDAWENRAILHRAAGGMPRWLRTGDRAARRAGVAQRRSGQDIDVWRDALRTTSADGPAHAARVQAFLRQCHAAYARIEARPPLLQRAARVEDWAEADPLKPYALAAVRALLALTREVRVGASAIDVFGPKPRTARTLAGAACVVPDPGGLLGRHGKRVGELLQLIASLEENKRRPALARAIAALRG